MKGKEEIKITNIIFGDWIDTIPTLNQKLKV